MLAPHISVVNLGCRVNRVESDRITADLMRLGFAIVDPQDADLIVINTCAVTGEAEAKTRKAVRHALAHPNDPYVVVTRLRRQPASRGVAGALRSRGRRAVQD